MSSLLIFLSAGAVFLVAYRIYGGYLERKVFRLKPDAPVPSSELRDDKDFCPTRKEILFGHHFTSIAGTGPIVGPAIAVFWGWLPALLWIVFGNIFIGAVHDFSSLVVSIRSKGCTIGEAAGRYMNGRARILFLLILFLSLVVVIGIFGLVIAVVFAHYPSSVLATWISLPVAVLVGFWMRRTGRLLIPSVVSLAVLYAAVWFGAEYLPIDLSSLTGLPLFGWGNDTPEASRTLLGGLSSVVVVWTGILLAYCFIASVLPVWTLLQPRDYINSQQLILAMFLLILGILLARPEIVAPAINPSVPADAPPIFPFLFITIACGAVSGFHSLVSSGTSSKQIERETDARFIGYGSMLLEGLLAVIVIIACTAGLGLGVDSDSGLVTGGGAWAEYYGSSWSGMTLARKVGAFIDGGGNLLAALGLSAAFASGIMAVLVACFAATTLDTATRLQRYVIQEIGGATGMRFLEGKYTATFIAVATGGALALVPGPFGPGSGGLVLWPLFGATNQLLAGMAFLVVAFYLLRRKAPLFFLVPPMLLMLILPAWAMAVEIISWFAEGKWLLFVIGIIIEVLGAWMILEAALLLGRIPRSEAA